MKVVLNSSPKQGKSKYPYLGITNNERIILFTAPSCGVVLSEPPEKSYHEIGYTSSEWGESIFNPYDGEIILSND